MNRHIETILYEVGDFTVRSAGRGYEVYRNEATASVRCAQIGYEGREGLARAIREADRRHAMAHPSTEKTNG